MKCVHVMTTPNLSKAAPKVRMRYTAPALPTRGSNMKKVVGRWRKKDGKVFNNTEKVISLRLNFLS